MGTKRHTVILVPHGRARFRKWEVTTRQLLAGTAVGIVLLIVSILSSTAILTRAVDNHQLAALTEENRQLRQVNREFETNLRELRTHLTEVEQRTEELAIVAGLDGLDVTPQSGIGGVGVDGRLVEVEDTLDRIAARLSDRTRLIAATPAISPVRGILTSGYGWRTDPVSGEKTHHRAVDLSTAPNGPVLAAADGIILKAERNGRLGNSVLVSHGFGFTTRYAHLARFNVQAGQRVKRGDTIGFVGKTGRATGYHLHYEVRLDGKLVDPMPYMLDETPRRY